MVTTYSRIKYKQFSTSKESINLTTQGCDNPLNVSTSLYRKFNEISFCGTLLP